ncbi:hypothetical protein I79_004831 [Cricetulus griseus]|uniref:Uncharacterized protein n=1 Tax=Cricetulus griseus TaxID=10029 RepID=G3H3I4_CRIGR|nr:hypothetical protein I79_004831 [Cricetulus griseus]ERE74336.1 hypothetical protein H671_5g13474 [Cricetulus griseus]
MQTFPNVHPKAHIFTVNSRKPKYEKSDFEKLTFELDCRCFPFGVFKHQPSQSAGSRALDPPEELLKHIGAMPLQTDLVNLGYSLWILFLNTLPPAAVAGLKT